MSQQCPFGWKLDPNDNKRMVKDEEERGVIDIVVMYYKKGKPLREIARTLTEKGTKNRSGKKWHHYQVKRILEREGCYSKQKEEESTDANS